MLYIFDLGNVIVDIDFNRALGVWSDLGRVPLALLQSRFEFDENVEKHERGEISDEEFADALCARLDVALSFEQFTAGWQAIFVDVRQDVLLIMQKLRAQGDRVVILSNTNQLHCTFWPTQYPEVQKAADQLYLSQEMGLRKPDPAIYLQVLQQEGFRADQTVFFDDNQANIDAARELGIDSVLVSDAKVIPGWFAGRL